MAATTPAARAPGVAAALIVWAVCLSPLPARSESPEVGGAPDLEHVAEEEDGGGEGAPAAELGRDAVAVELAVDVPVALGAGVLAGGMFLAKDELVRSRCGPWCDESAVNALDRPVVGAYSPAAATVGDVLVGLNLSLPFALGAIDWASGHHPDGGTGYGTDATILAQTLAVSVLVHQATAFATQRPRPYVYSDEVDPERRDGSNAYLSFYSGHTANSFAMATAYSYLYTVRHPHSPWRGGVWALTHGLAALEGYLRISSGYHFASDVLVGAAVGSGLGLLIPWLHRRPDERASAAGGESDSSRREGSHQLLLLPQPVPGGVGLTLSIHGP